MGKPLEPENKKALVPNWEESEFAKTVDGQILLMVKRSIKDKHFIEAQALSWATIEELLLPRLIGWIAKELKLNLPKDVYKLNAQNINYIYLSISHDEHLYKKLEICRKQRNKITHQITKQENMKDIEKLAKLSTQSNLLLQREIMKRFSGEFLIPSINLYRNGWNMALDSVIKNLKMEIEEIKHITFEKLNKSYQ